MDLAPRHKRQLKYTGAFFCALVIGVLSSFAAERVVRSNAVLQGVIAEGRDLSGLKAAELSSVFEARSEQIAEREFQFSLDGKVFVLQGREIGAQLDLAGLSKSALEAGREGGLFAKLGFSWARMFDAHEIQPQATVNESILGDKLSPWVENIVEPPRLPVVEYKKKLYFTSGAGGAELDVAQLADRVRAAAVSGESNIEVPLKERAPVVSESKEVARKKQLEKLLDGSIVVAGPEGEEKAKLTSRELGRALLVEVDEEAGDLKLGLAEDQIRSALRRFLEKLEVTPTEASFEFDQKGSVTVGESAPGKKADLEKLIEDVWAASESDKRSVRLQLITSEPKLSQKDAEGLGVKELVSSFVTHHPCCQTRVKNIHHAAGILDGTVLRPGDTFSLNGLLGPRTRAAGYFEAPTIVRGEMKDVHGGGISQLATTLFNAVLRGGYEIIQRQPHSVYFSRYPEGHEATVSFPEPDLIFKNDTKSGMVIRTQYTQTFIKVLVYGDGEGRVTTVKKSRRYDIVDPPKEYEPDEEMDPAEQKRLRAGQLGWTVKVSRTVKTTDGEEKTEAREVVYNPRAELLRVHPCVIPEGEEGHTGEECPEPEIEEVEEELSEDEYFDTE